MKSSHAKIYMLRIRSDLSECLVKFVTWLGRRADIAVKPSHSDQAKKYSALQEYL